MTDTRSELPTEPSIWARWSDRVNPILVREVQQATRSRGFVITLGSALLAILVTALVVSRLTARTDPPRPLRPVPEQ